MAKLDVLLINPGNVSEVYQELGSDFSAIETPSLAALFATYLRNKGLTVDILDAAAFNLGLSATVETINLLDPVLAVLVVYGFQPSASTQNMEAAGKIAKGIRGRSPEIKVMMTGTHPAALPTKTIKEEEIDFVANGEGPQTIYETLVCLKELKDLRNVAGLTYGKGVAVHSTPPGPLIEDLDKEMPGAAWDLLPMDRYRAHNWHSFEDIFNRKPYASIHTSLGCPFKCSFCCINAPFGKPSYRMWSPEAVGKEIDILYNKYGVKNIKFVDEMFVLNKEHVLGVCDELIKRDYNLNIWAYARIDTIRDEFLLRLYSAGFRWLALGIESGSKHVRDGVEKGRFNTTEILQTVRKVKEAGINVIGNYIFGLPDDTHLSMKETLDLALEAKCEFANFYSAMAYPGSKLYTEALKKGWKLPETWLGYSQHSYECQPLPTEHLTAREVLKFRDDAFHTYFENTAYLRFIEAKFGVEVLKNLKEMTKIRLKRKILE